MHYRNIASLNAHIALWAGELPDDLELVVAIPRSGLLAATLLGLHRNLPVADLEGFLEGRILSSGSRLALSPSDFLRSPRHALVLDDSLGSGKQMRAAKERLSAASLFHSIKYAAVYVTPGGAGEVDYYWEILPQPRWFEWNLMHHGTLKNACMDIDGVLCRDPTDRENDDGPHYREFLRSAIPLHLPTVRVGHLVTCRLEKYRRLTEEWLARHGVDYGELIMMNYPDHVTRRAAGTHAQFKADVYRQTGAHVFIESSYAQAVAIAAMSGMPVICTETQEILGGQSAVGPKECGTPKDHDGCWGAGVPGANIYPRRPAERDLAIQEVSCAYLRGIDFGREYSEPSPMILGTPRWMLRQWGEGLAKVIWHSVSFRRRYLQDARKDFAFTRGAIKGVRLAVANRRRLMQAFKRQR